MDEITLIAIDMFHIEVNHFKFEIIWQNMQEKISDICFCKPRYRPMGGSHWDGYSGPTRNIGQIILFFSNISV
jgi:hypothetical protein